MPEIQKILAVWSSFPLQGKVEVQADHVHKVVNHIKEIRGQRPEILSINNQEHGYFEDPENV